MSIKAHGQFCMVTWEKFLKLKGESGRYLPPIGTCNICYKHPAPNVVIYISPEAFLVNTIPSRGLADICSEECFNLWLLKETCG